MSRGQQTFKQRDVTKAVKATVKAGIAVVELKSQERQNCYCNGAARGCGKRGEAGEKRMGRGSPMRHPPKFVQAFIDRNGKPRFYLRRPGFKSVPLPGLPWSPQIHGVYEAALSGQPSQIGERRTKPGTISAAIIGYY